jgi:alpha-L-rhamnosidase
VNLDWQGNFIGGGRSHREEPGPAPYFRGSLRVGPGLRRAELSVTGLGLVEAYVNGHRVGDEVLCPGWTSYRHRLLVSSHDVTGLLVEGNNVLGAIVGEGWAVGRLAGWAEKRAKWSDRPAAYLQLELDYGERVEVVTSDRTWTTSTGAIQADGIYDGEAYDARLEPVGWAEPGFDDSGWSPVELVDWDMGTLARRSSPPIRRTEELPVREILRTPGGRTVADFGQVLSGWVRLTVDGPAGTTIVLRHCELLVNGEPDYETLRSAAATDRYTLRGGGPESWEPRFTFHGFRYVSVEGWPGELSPTDLTAVVVHSDVDRTGWFETSDSRVTQLHRNVVWSFRGNAVGLPTDCPQRDERLGWTGDINAFAPTAAFLYDVRAFLGSWLEDLHLEQIEKGTVPMVVPDVLLQDTGPTALWGDVAVGLPWTLYMEYGEVDGLRRQYPSMKMFVESVLSRLDDRGLWTRGFQFGDWLDPDAPPKAPSRAKTESALVANAYLCRTLEQFGSAASVLGFDEDRRWAADAREKIRVAFRYEWVTGAGRLANETQTGYALSICFGLLDPEQEPRAGDRLAELVTQAGYHIGTGFAGTPWLLPALTRCGHTDVAYRLLLQTTPPSFLYPVTIGATTIWERWDAVQPDGKLNSTGMTSLNHYAFGSVADWLHRVVGGIDATAPGYRRVRIAPTPGGRLEWARTAHQTVHGRIGVDWKGRSGERQVRVSLPEGVTAEVVLPGHPEGLVATVEGGIHEWTYPVEPDRFGVYNLDTPFSVLKADPVVWPQVASVFNSRAPEGMDVTAYVERQYPTLRAAVTDLPADGSLETELLAALEVAE